MPSPPELPSGQQALYERNRTLTPLALSSQIDEVLVAELRRMLRRHLRMISLCTAACLLLAGGYLLIKAPQYEAGAQIEVRPAGSNSLGLDEMAAKLFSPAEANTELQSAVQVLQSNTIAVEVMQQLHMAERSDFAGHWQQERNTSLDSLAPQVRDQLLGRFRKS